MSIFQTAFKHRKDREIVRLVEERRVIGEVMDLHLYKNQKYAPWDYYIHPSSLNWASRPEAQLKKMMGKRRNDAPLIKTFRLGDIIHDDIQGLLNECLFKWCNAEQHFESKRLFFRGTPDLFGYVS